MNPQFRVINMFQGQTLRKQFLFVDGDQNPIDLSARTARMQVRRSIEDAEVLFELTTLAGITMDAGGLVTLSLDAEETAALGLGDYFDQQWVYDLEIVTAGSPPVVDRVLTGVVTFSPEVTRA